jgi:DNA repair protein RadC
MLDQIESKLRKGKMRDCKRGHAMFTSGRQATLFEIAPPKVSFKEWKVREGNRLYSVGAKQLSDTELLAHLVRDQNIAEALMRHFSSLEGMACASIDELKQIDGIGSATAEVIVAALEFGRRALRKRDFDKVSSPQSVDDLLRDEMKMLSQEEMRILILDNQNQIKKIETVFVGTLDNITVHQREIFKSAIKASAKSIILVHNHPSGNAEPSAEDRHITKELVKAGKLIGISVIDHIIITEGRYYSFKEGGEL